MLIVFFLIFSFSLRTLNSKLVKKQNAVHGDSGTDSKSSEIHDMKIN